MGRHHARLYSQLDGCELVAVIDRDFDRAKAMASEHGGTAYASIEDVTEKLDAVSVAVPTVFHADVAVPLLERGVACLIEKPLAPDAKTAGEILAAAKRHGALVQVGHSERFNPVVQAMLRMGIEPQFVETDRISPFTFRSADIGVVFDMMIHDLDIVLHLVRSDPEQVDAVGVNVLGSCEDVANARVRFASGAVANLTASRLALKTERKIRVFSPAAYLSMDYHKKSGIAIKVADNVDLIRMAKDRDFEDLSQMASLDFGSMVKIEPLEVADVEPLRAELEAFLASVRSGEDAVVSAEDGFRAVDLAERITKSIADQNWGGKLSALVDRGD